MPGATRTGFFKAGGIEGDTLIQRLPMPTAEAIALTGWAGMQRGRRVVVPGADNKLFALSARLLPRALVLWITGLFLRRR